MCIEDLMRAEQNKGLAIPTMKKIVCREREKKMLQLPPDVRTLHAQIAEMKMKEKMAEAERRGRERNLPRDFNPPFPRLRIALLMIIMLLVIVAIVITGVIHF